MWRFLQSPGIYYLVPRGNQAQSSKELEADRFLETIKVSKSSDNSSKYCYDGMKAAKLMLLRKYSNRKAKLILYFAKCRLLLHFEKKFYHISDIT